MSAGNQTFHLTPAGATTGANALPDASALTGADEMADLSSWYGLNAIEQRTRAIWPHFAAQALASVDSTNSELMRRARLGQCAPTLLIAREQTAGKGRLGKTWASNPHTSLTFSLGITLAPADWSGLSLVVGIAVMQSLEQLCGQQAPLHTLTAQRPQRLGLKWPNDLWSMNAQGQGRKLGGILVETAALPPVTHQASHGASAYSACNMHTGTATGVPRYAVIGIGLNLHQPANTPAAGTFSVPPASLDEWLPASASTDEAAKTAAAQQRGKKARQNAHTQTGAQAGTPPAKKAGKNMTANAPALILQAIIPTVAAALTRFESEGFAPWQDAFAKWDLLHQRHVNLSDGQSGLATGVNSQGELLLRTAQGTQIPVNSGEVSVRPA